MSSQSPIKVGESTKERIRYLATVANLTQGEVVDRAVQEYAVRHADMIEKGLDHRDPCWPAATPPLRRTSSTSPPRESSESPATRANAHRVARPRTIRHSR